MTIISVHIEGLLLMWLITFIIGFVLGRLFASKKENAPKEHVHSWSKWELVNGWTKKIWSNEKTECVLKERRCSKCGDVELENL